MKRTSEDAFEATIHCIAQLEDSPIEILGALKAFYERRLATLLIAKKRQGESVQDAINTASHNVRTITESTRYVEQVLSRPGNGKEFSYERVEKN